MSRPPSASTLGTAPRWRGGDSDTALRDPAFPYAAVVILLLGAVLRLAAFDETMIEPDQAAILDSAFQVAHLRYFPLTGMKSSVGVMQTGLVPLLAAIPLLVVKRVIAVQWFFSALDLLALAWLYAAVRRAFGRRAAWLAALLYAAAPWVVLYSRTIWYQTLIAGLSTTAFSGLLVCVSSDRAKPRILIVTILSITMLSLVHLAAAPWGAILLAVCFVVASRRRAVPTYLLGVGLGGLLVLPYGLYLLQSSFGDLAYILTAGRDSTVLNTAAYRLASELITGSSVIANAHGDLWDRSVLEWRSADGFVLAVFACAVLWAIVSVATSRPRRKQLLLTLAWCIAVPTLFLGASVHLQHFYLMGIFPAPLVLMGACVGSALERRLAPAASKLLALLGYLVSGLLVLVAVWWSGLWVGRIGLEAAGELQRDTRGWLMDRTARTVSVYLEEEPAGQVVVLADFSGDGSSFEWLRGYSQSDRVRVVPIGKGLLIPSDPTCYVLGPDVPVDTLGAVAINFTQRPELTIPANPPWTVTCGQADTWNPHPLASWTNGLSLLDTEVDGDLRGGAALYITHSWHYRAVRPGDYHFYNHLLLDGELVSQVDGSGVPHWHWRDGDVLVTYFTLQLPSELQPGDYSLKVGMYAWPSLEGVPLSTGGGGYTAFSLTHR